SLERVRARPRDLPDTRPDVPSLSHALAPRPKGSVESVPTKGVLACDLHVDRRPPTSQSSRRSVRSSAKPYRGHTHHSRPHGSARCLGTQRAKTEVEYRLTASPKYRRSGRRSHREYRPPRSKGSRHTTTVA